MRFSGIIISVGLVLCFYFGMRNNLCDSIEVALTVCGGQGGYVECYYTTEPAMSFDGEHRIYRQVVESEERITFHIHEAQIGRFRLDFGRTTGKVTLSNIVIKGKHGLKLTFEDISFHQILTHELSAERIVVSETGNDSYIVFQKPLRVSPNNRLRWWQWVILFSVLFVGPVVIHLAMQWGRRWFPSYQKQHATRHITTGKERYAPFMIFAAFFVSILIKCLFFNEFCIDKGISFNLLWKNPTTFWAYSLPKISIALFLAAPTFFFRRNIWILFPSILLDVILLSLSVYYRSNGVLMDVWCVSMAGNMKGFWSSIFLFIEWSDIFYPLLTVLLAVVLFIFRSSHRILPIALVTLAVAYLCTLFGTRLVCEWRGKDAVGKYHTAFCLNPFNIHGYHSYYHWVPTLYCNDFSPIHYVVYQCQFIREIVSSQKSITPVSREEMDPFLNMEAEDTQPETPLILCMIESLESWVIREDVMPNLCRFVKSNDNILLADNVISQKRSGTSSDAQLILETGILPIQEGAVCFRYPENTFPSLNALYREGKTVAMIPHELTVWNQAMMNKAFHYDTAFVCSPYDKELFRNLVKLSHDYVSILTFTVSSHTPFTTYADSSNLILPSDMPVYMSNYMKSIHFVDESLKLFLDAVESDSILSNFTILLMGDHNIFSPEKRKQFQTYCMKNNLDYDVMNPCCPCLIYSPNIEQKIHITEEVYQMDIYPSMLDILGADTYWKGFGETLLDTVALHHRKISANDALKLSDRIIKSDFFKMGNE